MAIYFGGLNLISLPRTKKAQLEGLKCATKRVKKNCNLNHKKTQLKGLKSATKRVKKNERKHCFIIQVEIM
jgi:hypothetical protein